MSGGDERNTEPATGTESPGEQFSSCACSSSLQLSARESDCFKTTDCVGWVFGLEQLEGSGRTGLLRAVTAQTHGNKSLSAGEGTLGQLNQDQLGFGISLAHTLCGSGLAFLQVAPGLCVMRQEMKWGDSGS